MTNKEWLDYLAHNAPDELAAWFDAEHAEHQERALDGDTDALNAKIAALEKKLRISWEYECKFQDERDVLQEQVDELTAERDKLKGQVFTLKCECDDLESTCNVLENDLYNVKAERERYRSKFGKCIDYADAIHALMDDEGMA